MTPTQLRDTKTHYLTMFCTDMDPATVAILRRVRDVDQLDRHQEDISAGEYDAAEAILLGLT
jgi:hypothetical protein